MILRSPVVVTVFAASAMRFLGGYSIASYLPIYYSRAFPHYNDQYSVINAFVVSLGGTRRESTPLPPLHAPPALTWDPPPTRRAQVPSPPTWADSSPTASPSGPRAHVL